MSHFMKVPCFLGKGKIGWSEKPVPVPGNGQLLIKVKANALCGSDKKQFFQGTEIIPGHEASGIVIAAGEGTSIAVGTPGVVFLMDFCQKCNNCKRGNTNLCEQKRGDMGFNKDGGYAPYMLIHENIFFPIDPSLPLSEATMLLDIMGTGGHAIKRAKLIREDIGSVLVAGAGPIGLGVLAMSKLLLGNDVPVYIFDFIPTRLELARKLGGYPILLSETTLSQGLAAYGVDKVDVSIDTSGKTTARQEALNVLNKRGVLVCVGHGEGLQLEISKDIIAPQRSILGSEYFQFDELAGNHELLKQNLNYLSDIITHRFNINELQVAYETFFKGDTGKVIIEQ